MFSYPVKVTFSSSLRVLFFKWKRLGRNKVDIYSCLTSWTCLYTIIHNPNLELKWKWSNPCSCHWSKSYKLWGKKPWVFGSFGSKAGAISIRRSHHPEIMQDHQDESASGQIIIFHTPRFPWNSRGFLETSATFWRPRSVREVAIIWPELYKFMAWSSFHLPSHDSTTSNLKGSEGMGSLSPQKKLWK